jgi:protein farnesyltransferase/geranylgeranyltransferase type-1 subunit alpha
MANLDGWSDVSRVYQDDGPNPVASIQYDEKCKFFTFLSPIYSLITFSPPDSEKMDIFRAVYLKREYSPRVLNLTTDILQMNPANYTVWQVRRACLEALGVDLTTELDYLDTFVDENPKNYQIWYHRRVIVESIDNGDRECQFCCNVFDIDAKNYHAWAHRQWAVKRFSLWNDEFSVIDRLLVEDVRNNSAWNHRWFIIHEGTANGCLRRPDSDCEQIILSELEYVLKKIFATPNNESAWNYLHGLYVQHDSIKGKIIDWCKSILPSNSNEQSISPEAISSSSRTGTNLSKNIHFMGMAASIFEDYSLIQLANFIPNSTDTPNPKSYFEDAQKLFLMLKAADQLRVKYWSRRAEKCTHHLKNLN